MRELLLQGKFNDDDKKKIQAIVQDYELVEDIASLKNPSELEIVLGWSPDLTDFIQNEAHKIKYIQTTSAGVNSLPLQLLAEKGIQLANASGVHGGPIAESVFGFLLGHIRKLPEIGAQQKDKIWQRYSPMDELRGKTVMLVGTGSIGQHIATLAKAFSAHTIGVSRRGRDVENIDRVYKQSEIHAHIADADIVISSLPETPSTNDIFDRELFNAMKPGTIFINVGRGNAVVEEDLVEALDSGQVGQAFLDVFKVEPLPETSPLWEREDVFISPHTTARRKDYNSHVIEIFTENFRSLQETGEISTNVADYESGY